MIEYSQHIYTGKVGQKDNNPVNVYLSGTWIILTDICNKVVITVYKIDFNKKIIYTILIIYHHMLIINAKITYQYKVISKEAI